MKNLTMNQILNADFRVSEQSPIIKPFGGSFIVADPSVLTPDMSCDKKWHLFLHTNFGVYDFVGDDGVNFKKSQKIVGRAMRPNINFVDGKYYLFYERTRPVIANALTLINATKWKSEIYLTESEDLKTWSEPKLVIGNTRDYENCERGLAISNPFLLRDNGVNRLYYSCGLTYIDDCKFCEPTHISYAESECIDSGYVSIEKPIISPDKESQYLNLCSGCLKVYKVADGYIGVQNGIYGKDGKSHSAIFLLTSSDGINFNFEKPIVEPKVVYDKDWMAQFVYASHLVRYGDKLRLYFNARDKANPILGSECIGFAEANI